MPRSRMPSASIADTRSPIHSPSTTSLRCSISPISSSSSSYPVPAPSWAARYSASSGSSHHPCILRWACTVPGPSSSAARAARRRAAASSVPVFLTWSNTSSIACSSGLRASAGAGGASSTAEVRRLICGSLAPRCDAERESILYGVGVWRCGEMWEMDAGCDVVERTVERDAGRMFSANDNV
jgi:hypothetical protein